MTRMAAAAADQPLAPIAIFAYRRPTHLDRLLQSLAAADLFEGSPLFVFCDGARDESDRSDVERTRAVARARLGGRARIIENPLNHGLAESVIQGVTQLCSRYGRAIAFEDDLVVHPGCLHFLNAALDRYADEARVFHINAYRYPLPASDALCFSRLCSSWGWATWQRAWGQFEADAGCLAQQLLAAGLTRSMDFDGSFPYYEMLRCQARGEIDSWAIRWYGSALLRGGLALYPSASQVANFGFDKSGIHCGVSSDYDVETAKSTEAWPAEVAEDADNFRQMRDFFRSIRPTLTRRILRRVKRTMLAGRAGGNV